MEPIISYINGPVVRAKNATGIDVGEMVLVGEKKLIAEVINVENDDATIQVYEETSGLKCYEKIKPLGKSVSVKLGPGIMGNIFDGIQRPLPKIREMDKTFIPEGIGLLSIDDEKEWEVEILVKEGDYLRGGEIYAKIQESIIITHYLMVPPNIEGKVISLKPSGKYKLEDEVVTLLTNLGNYALRLYQEWPIKTPRPIISRNSVEKPLLTGQRVIDSFFPLAKGGAVAIPGGFGTGKTITQHQIAKFSDADIIIYIGCGERGNEITEVLQDFPEINDPKTGKSIMERTVLIANTSNMPVAAREASIYTGITIAEYYRDMGYSVAIMADSTSRWAEALREISARLEEMPAEEGYPAYLPSRLASFYERAGDVKTLSNKEGSVTIIGAVSPAGGDLSEPVTLATKRVVNAFLALDKNLAYARHYPAINWLTSYSGYIRDLKSWYDKNVSPNMFELRVKFLSLLQEEDKLSEIVKLVGEDVLPDDQRLILEIAKVIKNGFLQQNAYHKDDASVSIKKQYLMLKAIDVLYENCLACIKKGIPLSKVKNDELFYKFITLKYNVREDELDKLDLLEKEVISYYNDLLSLYEGGM